MPEQLRQAAFAQHINTEFHVQDDNDSPLSLQLTQVTKRIETPQQEAFSLFFHGPASSFMPQGMHKLRHAALGDLDIFLVPVGRDENGFEYEAVFNHLLRTRM